MTDEQQRLEGMPAPVDVHVPAPDAAPELDATPTDKPKAKRARRATTQPTARRAPRAAKVDIQARVAELYSAAGMALSIVPSKPSATGSGLTVTTEIGMAIASSAEQTAKAWKQLADENPAVRQAIERLLTVTAFGALVTAHLPIIMATLAATGALQGAAGQLFGSAPAPAAPSDKEVS